MNKELKYASDSRRVKRNRRAEGPSGLLGRFRVLLPRLRWWSKSHGHTPPRTTPDEMLKIWELQNGLCAACSGPMELRGINASCFDHDHKTGEPRGFIHKECNGIEGLFSKMSDERVEIYLSWMKRILARRAETTQVAPVMSASLAG